ncbi:DUF1236 domain-containing protein [Bradyrhizobium sp. USDA 10063]
MTNRLLISVATAALIAGTGFANAQGTGMGRESPSSGGGATTQHSAPSGGGASSGTMNRDSGGTSGMSGAEQSGKGSGSSGMRSDSDRGGAADRNAQDTAPGQKSKSMSSDNERTKSDKGMKAEGREGRDRMNAEPRDKSGMQPQKGATDTSRSQTTTGNAATSATAAPPAEKRTQIVSAIRSERVEEVRNVNFNVSVGATVPTTVRFHPLPSRIVEIYPEWRGYQFILVGGRYVIVRPQTHEIVYILEG